MASWYPQLHQIARGVVEARWVTTGFVASTDIVHPVELTGYNDRNVIAQGTWNGGGISLVGSNVPATAATTAVMTGTTATGVPIADPLTSGVAIAFTADGIKQMLDSHRWVRWTATSASTATGEDLTVRIIAMRKRA